MSRYKVRVFSKLKKKFLPASTLSKYKFNLLTGEFLSHKETQDDPAHFIIQGFTGFKDKNNKDIFEGDILYHESNATEIFTVVWEETFGAYILEDQDETQILSFSDTSSDKWIIESNIFNVD